MASGGQDSGRERVGRQTGKAPRDNKKQNKQVDYAASKAGLTKAQRKDLHSRIGHQGLDMKDLLEEAKDIKNRRKGEKPWKKR